MANKSDRLEVNLSGISKNGLEMLLAEIAFDQPGREHKPPG